MVTITGTTTAVTNQDYSKISSDMTFTTTACPSFDASLKTTQSYVVTGILLTCASATTLSGITLTGTGTVEITGAVTTENYGNINCGGVTFSTTTSLSLIHI